MDFLAFLSTGSASVRGGEAAGRAKVTRRSVKTHDGGTPGNLSGWKRCVLSVSR